jgi:hypothetical protein
MPPRPISRTNKYSPSFRRDACPAAAGDDGEGGVAGLREEIVMVDELSGWVPGPFWGLGVDGSGVAESPDFGAA